MKYYKPLSSDIGQSVLDILSRNKEILPDTPCGGKASCGKCRMRLTGALSEASDCERAMLGEDFYKGYRLICLACVQGDFGYETPDNPSFDIQTESEISVPSLCATGKHGTALAVDLGTTTAAIYLVDMSNGEIIAKSSFVNPQRVHGADVISRIRYALEGGADILKEEIIAQITEAVHDLCEKEPDYAVICGNTVMEHFITGKSTKGIAALPFTPDSLFGYETSLPFCKRCYIAPCVASYVGGDITVGAAAAGLDKVKELTLYIDLGTNGEIVLANPSRILCCAAAAGPAFEAANIECGMSARAGAVCRVRNDKEKLVFDTVAGATPLGICGSGLIDAAAVLLRLGEIDETGRLSTEKYYLDKENNIYISDKDIRQLQLAKAAVAAGIKVLLCEMKASPSDVKKVLIAGGFGAHIDCQNAAEIGLIPYGVDAPMLSLGNCAGIGAARLAASQNEITRTEALCRRMEYIELSGNKKFNELYIEEMMFE